MEVKKIKMIVMDVDGTLTDGKIVMGIDGEVSKAFNAKDGLRIKQLPSYGIIPVVITGRNSQIVVNRMKEHNITEFYQGVSKKVEVLEEILKKYNLTHENVAYIGDDENDYMCMKLCALKGCPADAAKRIKEIADFISIYNGGDGAVREFLDYILVDELKNSNLDCEY